MLDSAALALGFAHTQGVVHRDIKPGNLFLSRTRTGTRLKVLDFGLAKIVDPEGIMAPAGAETGSHVFIASPSYGAPEQFSKKLGAVGPWSDVYSLALVALEMLTCAKVRPAKNLVEGMMRALDPRFAEQTPRKLGLTVGDAVEAAFARATALDSRKRFQDGAEAWAALRRAVREEASYSSVAPPTVRNDPKQGLDKTVAMMNAPVIPAMTPLPLSNGSRTLAFGPGQQAPIAAAPGVGSVPSVPSARAVPSVPSGSSPTSSARAPLSQGMPSSRSAPTSAPRKASGALPMWLALLLALVLSAAGVTAVGYALRVSKK
jgi:serine/threonine protein kinase